METEQPKDKSVGAAEIVTRFLTDNAFKDLTLEGNDGVQVRTNRYVLAARSPVFESMLLGNFAEASSSQIKLDFEGEVLKAFADFAHTDTLQTLSLKKRKAGKDDASDIQIRTLVALEAAASFFAMPSLSEKIFECLSQSVDQFSPMCFVLFGEIRRLGAAAPEKLAELALSRVRSKDNTSVKAGGIASLSAFVVEEIIRDDKTKKSEKDLFEILRIWMEVNPSGRKPAAVELAKRICLEAIDPLTLSTTVASSGLVPVDKLMEVYKAQAIAAHEGSPIAFSQPRFHPLNGSVWQKSQSS